MCPIREAEADLRCSALSIPSHPGCFLPFSSERLTITCNLLSVCTACILCGVYYHSSVSLVMQEQGNLKHKTEDLGPWDKAVFEESIKVPKATLNRIRFYYHRNHPCGDVAGASEGLGSDGGGRRL